MTANLSPILSPVGRRNALRGLLMAGVAGTLVATSPTAAQSHTSAPDGQLTFDVACLYDTMVISAMAQPGHQAPLQEKHPEYGVQFLVEGIIFPAGILGDDTSVNPEALPGAMGTWVCRGFVTERFRSGRANPLAIATQNYLLNAENTRDPSVDQLASDGLEGDVGEDWTVARVITGGTGRFAGARGEVLQTLVGLNGSRNVLGNGHNFRFTFDFDEPPVMA